MKTLKLIATGIILLVSSASNAQLSISLNIGNAPVYRNAVAVDYYYLPDIQTYFDVRANQYVYLERGNWKRSRNLPVYYRDYDVRNGYRVALNDCHGNQPYKNYNNDRARYYVGYRGENQRTAMKRYNDRDDYRNNDYKGYKKEKYAYNDHHDNRDRYENNRR
ncbi:hypothetical protein [Flavobacterium muglaense]|uniref:Uncharacterized protein n=1 Tax=Flavobacterium muglaense TaxID=2764716 RepID=A0A923N1F9_9FLAO|nr:hypothetical protein [Flavobacterium muglaense]MBC5838759.1 hypothetical protein [Flavobacterium muglaense]MBC5845282.1 hypothetical protein [Flavobacterium muglaense]